MALWRRIRAAGGRRQGSGHGKRRIWANQFRSGLGSGAGNGEEVEGGSEEPYGEVTAADPALVGRIWPQGAAGFSDLAAGAIGRIWPRRAPHWQRLGMIGGRIGARKLGIHSTGQHAVRSATNGGRREVAGAPGLRRLGFTVAVVGSFAGEKSMRGEEFGGGARALHQRREQGSGGGGSCTVLKKEKSRKKKSQAFCPFMAIASRILANKTLTRPLSTLTSSPISLKLANPDPTPSPSPPQILDLTDTERLFSSIPTRSLVRSLAVLQALAVEPAVDVGVRVMRSRAVQESRWARAVLMGAVKRTVYGHFCAGAGREEVGRTVRALSGLGLKGILDYGSEDAEEEGGCDRNLSGFLEMVEMTSSVPGSSVSFACVKVTAICPISLLERLSDLLRWQKKDPSFDLPWKSHSIPILSESSPLYQTPSKPEPLTETEEKVLQLALNRLSTLCKRCAEVNLPILIDAEYTSVQPAIDYFTYAAALEFNQGDYPIVFGTIQAYLRDAKERMAQAVEAAEREGFLIGLKLVRGAYMTRETELAKSLGVPSPIHRSIQETHTCYDDCASFMLERVVRGSGSLVLATHNLESGKVAAAKAEELGIGKGNQNLQFSQLMGMADGLSLGLSNAGFQVSKYLPYGPVDQVIPYLLRRAEENRGMLSASTMDRDLIRKELKRRMTAAVLRKVY